MNLLADEGVEKSIVLRLRSEGHQVDHIAEFAPSLSDDEVLRHANSRDAMLLTSDKDFGELVYRLGRVHAGVILIRLAGLTSAEKSAIVAEAIAEHRENFMAVSASFRQVRFGSGESRSTVCLGRQY